MKATDVFDVILEADRASVSSRGCYLHQSVPIFVPKCPDITKVSCQESLRTNTFRIHLTLLWKQALIPHDADDAEHGSHGDDGADHDAQTANMVMHGLAVLIGIYCFMFVERLLSICTRCRRRQTDHETQQVIVVSQVDCFLCCPGGKPFAGS